LFWGLQNFVFFSPRASECFAMRKKAKKVKPAGRFVDAMSGAVMVKLTREGKSQRDVARLLRCCPKTVRNVLRREAETSQAPHATAAQLRKERRDSQMLALAQEKVPRGVRVMKHQLKFITQQQIARVLKVSSSTVSRVLRRKGVRSRVRPKRPFADTVVWRNRRKTFCRKMLRMRKRDLATIMFSDEKIFDTNDHGTRRQLCAKGQRPEPRQSLRWTPRVHLWGAIAADGFRFFRAHPQRKGGVTSATYIPMLESVLPSLRTHIFMQDGAPAHDQSAVLPVLWFPLFFACLSISGSSPCQVA
jgi:DNA-binding NarL/FixJ family response regulator